MEVTKIQLKREFEQHYPSTTPLDVREEAWNVFMDNAHREGRIPARAVDTWSNPYTLVKEPYRLLAAVNNDAQDVHREYTQAQAHECETPELQIAMLVAHAELAEVLQRVVVGITDRVDVVGTVSTKDHTTLTVLSFLVLDL